jgi:hypothetical protein
MNNRNTICYKVMSDSAWVLLFTKVLKRNWRMKEMNSELWDKIFGTFSQIFLIINVS